MIHLHAYGTLRQNFFLTWKSINSRLSGSCVYRWLLTIADMQCDKCTRIYNRNNAALYEPGTLKIRVTVMWTQAKFMCTCLRGHVALEYVCSNLWMILQKCLAPFQMLHRLLIIDFWCCCQFVIIKKYACSACSHCYRKITYKCKIFIIWMQLILTCGFLFNN